MALRVTDTLARLQDRFGLVAPVAYDPTWAAAPDFLALIADHVLAERPAAIVECSSGTSTVILAAACRQLGHGHVHSLENGPEFAAATRAELARQGLGGLATVIDAPLVATPVGERTLRWYDLDGLTVDAIDMLVIDGPPGFLQPMSRQPALPRLAGRLAPGAAIFLDDAGRPDERVIADAWCRDFPGLRHRHLDLERGAAVFRWPA